MRQGCLANVTKLRVTGGVFDDGAQQRGTGGLFAIMRCLPLRSCTFDSNFVSSDIYQFLPDTIRTVTDEANGNSLGCLTPEPLAQPCFRYIHTLEVSCFHVNTNHPWLLSPPRCLQRLVVKHDFWCDSATELRLNEMLPALVSIKLAVFIDGATERTLQQILQLPMLIKAHIKFAPEVVLKGTAWKLELSVPETVTFAIDQPAGVQVERVSCTKVICSFDPNRPKSNKVEFLNTALMLEEISIRNS